MRWRGPMYRRVDGERIDGVWCHVWRRLPVTGDHVVDDLGVWADGAIRCEEELSLAGLRRALDEGRIALTAPGAAAPPPPEGPRWDSRAGEPLTVDGFLLDVADRIEELNGRPTAADRLWDALARWVAEPGDEAREALAAAYSAVPPHRRVYVLGDMDHQDRPLRVLLARPGEAVDGDGPEATEELRAWARTYAERAVRAVDDAARRRAEGHPDDPPGPVSATVVSHESAHPRGWPTGPGLFVLRNDHPTPVPHAGVTYASVTHAYWALSAADPEDRRRIAAAGSAREARELGAGAARRADWADVRLAVMAALLRAKFGERPELAEALLATGDGRISWTGFSDSPYWRDVPDASGRNWMGRLLELTRSELRAGRAAP
ncbi:NADAR family protein [Streptomyces radicis]|uniref:NADAR family protein n=1 Tax=Streptomyces radicis TaxID=1750517 RepID=A0A3A9WCD4_9ACTN|nr:NADAR family protein [Streptomyces radicis]RKN10430.1 NADAR family protein [Streptomyces radicis]RKN24689.1 NADAR family protein [Streptomyces radicis]